MVQERRPGARQLVMPGWLALGAAVVINSFSVVLMLRSGAGISAISSVPYAIYRVTDTLTLGTWTYLFQGLLVLSLFVMRRRFVPQYLLSFVVGFCFGELLDLQERRRDFVFESAKVTARSNDNWRSTLTLSKGSESGIQEGNCVVTSTGVLVGVVSTVGSHYCELDTVIDTGMEMGGIITRTNAAGVLEGDFSLMQEGKLRLAYLPDEAQLVAGDEVLTSGRGDVYPSGLVVGQVEGVFNDASGMNRYAVVVPEVDLDTLVEVFVIKEFDIVE